MQKPPLPFRPWPDNEKYILDQKSKEHFRAFWGSVNRMLNLALYKLRGKGDFEIEQAIEEHRHDNEQD